MRTPIFLFFLFKLSLNITQAQDHHYEEDINVQKLVISNPAFWTIDKINVCWEASSSDYTEEKEWVKDAITNTWQKESNLQFLGWNICKINDKGIRIKIQDDKKGAQVIALGKKLDGVPNGLLLDFVFHNWNNALIHGELSRKEAIKTIAVHEFGHAIGFTHQQDRLKCILCNKTNVNYSSNESKAFQFAVSSNKDAIWFTPCDQFSVMNYCSNDYFNRGILSEYDIKAVRIIYGAPKNLKILSDSNKYEMYYTFTKVVAPNELFIHSGGRDGQKRMLPIADSSWKLVKVYLKTTDQNLDKISKVVYELDPTFKANNLELFQKANRFMISFYSYGRFTIRAKIFETGVQQPIIIEKDLVGLGGFKAIVENKEGEKREIFMKSKTEQMKSASWCKTHNCSVKGKDEVEKVVNLDDKIKR